MATQQNGTATLAEQLAGLGLDAETMAKIAAAKSGGTRVDMATGAPAEVDPLAAEIAQLRAENARLKLAKTASTTGTLTCHVSEKGCVSVYGLGRMPATFYPEQWERLLAFAPQIKAFIAKHEHVAETYVSKGVTVTRKLAQRR